MGHSPTLVHHGKGTGIPAARIWPIRWRPRLEPGDPLSCRSSIRRYYTIHPAEPLEHFRLSLKPVDQVPSAAAAGGLPERIGAPCDPDFQSEQVILLEDRRVGGRFLRFHGLPHNGDLTRPI
jgi:hypothetical protein